MASFVCLDSRVGTPLHRQLYESIRAAIVEGRLGAGARVPSTRGLALQLNVSRNTAMNAFEQLLAEGYLVGRAGSGTYVADDLPERATAIAGRARGGATSGAAGIVAPARPSGRARALASFPCPFRREPDSPIAFRVGTPDREHFPVETWGRLLARRWNRSGADLLHHGDPRGYAPLRRAVCDYVTTARGVRCTVERVLIVTGTQQGVQLAAQVLLDPGQAAWVEDPGYPAYRGALAASGASVVPVPVDAEGLDVAAGVRRRPGARLAIVTPAHQMPMGVALSAGRRAALLDWAAESDAWIFEDDYDSEFRYAGRPLPALQGAPGGGERVVYCGTFSKVMSPALRLAYLVVPAALVDAFVTAKAFADVQCPPLEQAVLTDFIAQGHFARHVRRMRVLYARRQAALIEQAARECAGRLDVRPMAAGMHLIGWLPPGADDREVSRRLRRAGVNNLPLSAMAIEAATPPALLLGYAGLPDAELAPAVRRMAAALR